ncbi:hypothetical protein LL06_22340 [Hoeflea sp. BAL378]|uniref:DUF1850 domain-containing protein n=1 Tax=Hoeflea sp. BAL378 TaxID=1547437 RepID=UPI0005145896|nr:DUF1850 domain-containing protein [Hoeflea sp. BAL378]KGF67432.1 hypothetical protein LL06_22340 [Hoeflea sp. BAL378]
MALGLCIAAGGKALTVAATLFTLSWTHSVEKTAWQESWRVTEQGLQLAEARVKGSGAGMDPGEGARLEDGWWVWSPDSPETPELVLAASGATVSAWTICHAGGCVDLGADAQEPIRIRPCDP